MENRIFSVQLIGFEISEQSAKYGKVVLGNDSTDQSNQLFSVMQLNYHINLLYGFHNSDLLSRLFRWTPTCCIVLSWTWR
jgi:hypothetical protein